MLEGGHAGGWLGGVVEAVLIVLILLNVIGFTLQSVPAIEHLYWFDLTALEIVSVAIFSVEYALRLWVSVEDPIMAELGPWRGRLRAAAKRSSAAPVSSPCSQMLSAVLSGMNTFPTTGTLTPCSSASALVA